MTLLDAIKKGGKFYRTCWEDPTPIDFSEIHLLSRSAVLADDWEVVEEEKKAITGKDFDEAIRAVECYLGNEVLFTSRGTYLQLLKKELFK